MGVHGEHGQQYWPDTGATRHTKVRTDACHERGNLARNTGTTKLTHRDGNRTDGAFGRECDHSSRPKSLEEINRIQPGHTGKQQWLHHEELQCHDDVGDNQHGHQRQQCGNVAVADGGGDQSQHRVRGQSDDDLRRLGKHHIAGVDECLERRDGLMGFGRHIGGIVSDRDKDGEQHDRHDLVVHPAVGKVVREQRDDRVQDRGHFVLLIIRRQLVCESPTKMNRLRDRQREQSGRRGVQQQEKHRFHANAFQPNGFAKVGDARDDAEEQQRHHNRGNHIRPNSSDRVDKINMAFEHDSENDA